MEQNACLRLLWQKMKGNEACLVRAYGNYDQAELPAAVEGCLLTAIAPYCFAENTHFPKGEIQETEITVHKTDYKEENHQASDLHRHELCGSYVTRISLPDTVRSIGNYAFYNCRKLSQLRVGKNTTEIGSDVFMNCLGLKKLILHSGAWEKTGLRQILSRISGNLEVSFVSANQTEAVLYYPEYMETYDEIAPAHIFGRGIAGEGFRARQGFAAGKIDFDQYDAVFARACVEESVSVLSRMAVNRLRYPAGLSDDAKVFYEAYVKAHDQEIAGQWIREKDLALLEFLAQERYLSKPALSAAIRLASSIGWMEGSARLLRLKERSDEIKSHYEFDDF